jgi:ATP-dependent Clp protease ATP-binding subunit ClpA
VVVFDMLRREHIVRIADRLLGQLTESVRERHRVELVPDTDTLHPWITERMSDPEHQAYGNELEQVRAAVVRHLLEHRPAPESRIRAAIAADGTARVTADGTVPRAREEGEGT